LTLKEKLVEVSRELPARFEEKKDGTLTLESKIAERKVFFSKKTLTYRARLRVDDEKKQVRFFEMLKETGIGVTSGGDVGDTSPGFGFKKEIYKTTGKAREGSIEELSKLFEKDYKYSWDYSAIRKRVEQETQNAAYSFSICLNEKQI
jgi:hypothetical protein